METKNFPQRNLVRQRLTPLFLCFSCFVPLSLLHAQPTSRQAKAVASKTKQPPASQPSLKSSSNDRRISTLQAQVNELRNYVRQLALRQLHSTTSSLPGTIMAFAGTLVSLKRLEKKGWYVCDGRKLPKNVLGLKVTPDLRNRFVQGSSLGQIGKTGGSTSHFHKTRSHTHSFAGKTGATTQPHKDKTACYHCAGSVRVSYIFGAHDHTFSGRTKSASPATYSENHIPPFYKVVFLIKVFSPASAKLPIPPKRTEASSSKRAQGNPVKANSSKLLLRKGENTTIRPAPQLAEPPTSPHRFANIATDGELQKAFQLLTKASTSKSRKKFLYKYLMLLQSRSYQAMQSLRLLRRFLRLQLARSRGLKKTQEREQRFYLAEFKKINERFKLWDQYVQLDLENKRLLVQKLNLQVVNGKDRTDSNNGLGNIIVGYNEKPVMAAPLKAAPAPAPARKAAPAPAKRAPAPRKAVPAPVVKIQFPFAPNLKASNQYIKVSRAGSHNLVVGWGHSYKSYGGLVAGYRNTIAAPYAVVSGGNENQANEAYSSVCGGSNNIASGKGSSVSGGSNNSATSDNGSVSGGANNLASGKDATVCGGKDNRAFGEKSSIHGGYANIAMGSFSSIGGGMQRKASQQYANLGSFPIGSIVPISGKSQSFGKLEKQGWYRCDGRSLPSNVLGLRNAPDLRSKFLQGASSWGSTGGSSSHYHSTPSHYHSYSGITTSSTQPHKDKTSCYHCAGTVRTSYIYGNHNHSYSGSTSSANPNTHSSSHIPPYYNVVYLIKVF